MRPGLRARLAAVRVAALRGGTTGGAALRGPALRRGGLRGVGARAVGGRRVRRGRVGRGALVRRRPAAVACPRGTRACAHGQRQRARAHRHLAHQVVLHLLLPPVDGLYSHDAPRARELGDTARMPDAQSVGALLDLSAERHGERAAVSWKQGEEWVSRTHAELRDTVRELALGLLALGVQAGERVCILANTRPEWTYFAYATWLAGAVVVPIYPTNSPEECEWVAGNSEASVVICEDESQLDKIRQVRDNLPALRTLVLIDGEAEDATSQLRSDPGGATELDARTQAVTPDDPLLIIYTSGTTGP